MAQMSDFRAVIDRAPLDQYKGVALTGVRYLGITYLIGWDETVGCWSSLSQLEIA